VARHARNLGGRAENGDRKFGGSPAHQGGFMEIHKTPISNAERRVPKVGAGGNHGVVNR
jgi:hypothetical protein